MRFSTVTVSEDGVIESFSKTDACPDNLSRSFVSESERNKLLEDEICRYLCIKSIDDVDYEIFSETLTLFHNKSSILYGVEITDKDGFAWCIMVWIS